ncbi:MAG: TetR/AcrR family transcriptional regulator, partial [Spirochaetes bacterium]|nr:TetR/AcrR family transcriptional regulator [Spirochaetota bacterium]
MKKKNKDSLNSQEKIIKAAVEEFAEFGFGGARVDRIAENAGLNKAMIYYHYKSKEVLYESIIKNFTSKIFENISNVPFEGVSPSEQLFSIINSYADYVSTLDSDIKRLMLRELAGGGKYIK